MAQEERYAFTLSSSSSSCLPTLQSKDNQTLLQKWSLSDTLR